MNGLTSAGPISAEGRRPGLPQSAVLRPIDLWWAAFAATLIPTSLIWDFSWESSIGVDRFWSPPHVATHVGVWLSGLLGAWLILIFSFSRAQGGWTAGVSIGRLCGPSGAWILLWGAVTLQAALLFDNWWQKAYGLGAGLWHPPQILKAVGFFTLLVGALVLCAGAKSNGTARMPTKFLVWHGGLLLTMCAVVLTMKNYPNMQHTASFYMISCAVYPAVVLAAGSASGEPWGTTRAALVYMIVVCVMIWLLPMFPARPLTAPIHNPTDHLMPPAFPLLLVVPALVMDWLRMRFFPQTVGGNADLQLAATTPGESQRPELRLAVAAGASFLVVFLLVQWLFSEFLLSAAADNWFFAGGGRHWPFFLKIDEAHVMFWGVKQDPLSWWTALLAMGFAVVSSWFGLCAGAWLSKLRR